MIRPAPRTLSAADYLRAGALTAILPVILAFAIYRLAPWGCDASAWLCLFPLSLLVVAPAAAVCLPVLLRLNRRRRRPFPDGPASILAMTGIAGQVLVSGTSLWLAEPHVRRIFLLDVLVFPQGLAAGVTAGLVFSVALAAQGTSGPNAR